MTRSKGMTLVDMLPQNSSVKKVTRLPSVKSRFGNGVMRKIQVEYCHRGVDYKAVIRVTKKVLYELTGSIE
jgi:hypothetical protein